MAETAGLSSIREDYLAATRSRRMYSGILTLIFVILIMTGFQLADSRNAGGFWDGIGQIFAFPAELLGEAWEKAANLPGLIWGYIPALIETINIALVSTLVGVMVGAYLSFFCTHGLAPYRWLIWPIRRLTDVLRAIPEVVIALVLIYVLGGGPVPAMIAIALHTMGAIGKLYSEVNENVDPKPLEGLQSVGATWGKRMWLGVVPQVAPNYISYALLRFEVNVRASAILGFVGAGGIGAELRVAIGWGKGRYDEAAAVFILLFLTIVVIDQASGWLRQRLTHGAGGEAHGRV
jgi:phosphonate transport system permease protein